MTDPGPWRGTDPSAFTISSKMSRWPSGTLSLVAVGSLAKVVSKLTGSTFDLPGKRVVVMPVPDHVVGIELRDLFLRVAQEIAEHFLVVLAHLGGGANDGRRAAEVPEVTGHGDRAGQEVGNLHHRSPLPGVRVLGRLRDGVHRS